MFQGRSVKISSLYFSHQETMLIIFTIPEIKLVKGNLKTIFCYCFSVEVPTEESRDSLCDAELSSLKRNCQQIIQIKRFCVRCSVEVPTEELLIDHSNPEIYCEMQRRVPEEGIANRSFKYRDLVCDAELRSLQITRIQTTSNISVVVPSTII